MDTATSPITRLINFLTTGIWQLRLAEQPKLKAFWLKLLRIILLSIRCFKEDQCQFKAAALTLYSLLSVVPVVAMAFGIAKGFGMERYLENWLAGMFQGQEEILNWVMDFARSMLETTQGGTVAGIGLAVLFWSVIKVLGNIETALNQIWHIHKARSMGRKFSDYLSLTIIGPILMIASSSAAVFIVTRITHITERFELLGWVTGLVLLGLKFLPFVLIWILFTVIYLLMPNMRIRFTSGLVAGIIAGTLYNLVQWGWFAFQVGVAKYNAIYGSFAALTLVLIWLQVSWMIFLIGAEISFAHQNVDTYELEPDFTRISPDYRKLLCLQITHRIVDNFKSGERPFTAHELSGNLKIPIRLANEILNDLIESEILNQVTRKGSPQAAYQPARDINTLTITSVLDALGRQGNGKLDVRETRALKIMADSLATFKKEMESSLANRALKDISTGKG
jgi:membrane protein